MKALTIVALAGVGLLAAAFAGVGAPEPARGEEAPPPNRTITVTGTGTVKTVPDEAQFSFGVETRADTAKAALDENARATRRLIAALKNAGISGDDLQTESVSVWPRSEEKGSVVDYVASNSVRATIPVAKAGAVVEAASEAGANHIWGPQLSTSQRDELYREALKDAVDDARTKAAALAEAAGVGVGRVLNVAEGGQPGEPIPYASRAAELGAADEATPIEPGKQEIQASVSVTFAIQ